MKVAKLRQWLIRFGPDEEVEIEEYDSILKVRRDKSNPVQYHSLDFVTERASKHVLVKGQWQREKFTDNET